MDCSPWDRLTRPNRLYVLLRIALEENDTLGTLRCMSARNRLKQSATKSKYLSVNATNPKGFVGPAATASPFVLSSPSPPRLVDLPLLSIFDSVEQVRRVPHPEEVQVE